MKAEDFRRWYDQWSQPAKKGGKPRVRRAHGAIQMMRRLMTYAAMTERAHGDRLRGILSTMRFQQPAPREVRLTRAQVMSFVETAIAAGRVSLALATALQFDCALRQRDVIGEWLPLDEGEPGNGGIVLGKRRWANGLTWADIGADLTFRKRTTKTGRVVAHDLKFCPLVQRVMTEIPADRRVGPMIIDERSGRPYAEHGFHQQWRLMATKAGLPKEVRSMDARAGAISEADSAGVPLDVIRDVAGHASAVTTQRYARDAPLEKARTVAKARQAKKGSPDQSGT